MKKRRDNLIIIAREDQSVFSTEWLNEIATMINRYRTYNLAGKPMARMLRSPDGYVFGVPLYFSTDVPKDQVFAIAALVPDPPVVVS